MKTTVKSVTVRHLGENKSFNDVFDAYAYAQELEDSGAYSEDVFIIILLEREDGKTLSVWD